MKGLARTAWFLPASGIVLWWVVRLGITGQMAFATAIAVGSLLNFGILLALSFLSDFQSDRGADFGIRFKQNLKGAVLYAFAAALSVGAFHHGVASEQTALRKLERERFIERSLGDEAAYAALQEQDPQLAALDRETALERAKESLRFQFDPRWHVTASLILLVATAASCALFATLMGGFLRS